MYLLAVFIAKLLDPILILLSLVADGFSQKWWQVIVGASVVAVIGELFLFSIQVGRTFDPVTFFLELWPPPCGKPRLVVIKNARLRTLCLLNQLYGALGFQRVVAQRVNFRGNCVNGVNRPIHHPIGGREARTD